MTKKGADMFDGVQLVRNRALNVMKHWKAMQYDREKKVPTRMYSCTATVVPRS